MKKSYGKRRKVPFIGILTLLLIVCVAVAAFFVSNRLSTTAGITPVAPESEPFAQVVSNEGGGGHVGGAGGGGSTGGGGGSNNNNDDDDEDPPAPIPTVQSCRCVNGRYIAPCPAVGGVCGTTTPTATPKPIATATPDSCGKDNTCESISGNACMGKSGDVMPCTKLGGGSGTCCVPKSGVGIGGGLPTPDLQTDSNNCGSLGNECDNGYVCVAGKCSGSTDMSCGRNLDTKAPVCCTKKPDECANKVCEKPSRLECKTTKVVGGKVVETWCLIKANSPDCGGSGDGVGGNTPTPTVPITLTQTPNPTKTPTPTPALVCEAMRVYLKGQDISSNMSVIKKGDKVEFKGFAPNTKDVVSMTFQVKVNDVVRITKEVPATLSGTRWISTFPYTFSNYANYVVKVISINEK